MMAAARGDRAASTLKLLLSTGTDGWRTPPELLAELDLLYNFVFDFASSGVAAVGRADRYFGPGSAFGEDALAVLPERWAELVQGGSGFLNPPYSTKAGRGRGIWSWHKAAWEASRHGATTVMLNPPHPGRRWWWEYATRCDEIAIYKGRIPFLDPVTGKLPLRWNEKKDQWEISGNSQDSALFIYRPEVPDKGHPGGARMRHITRSLKMSAFYLVSVRTVAGQDKQLDVELSAYPTVPEADIDEAAGQLMLSEGAAHVLVMRQAVPLDELLAMFRAQKPIAEHPHHIRTIQRKQGNG